MKHRLIILVLLVSAAFFLPGTLDAQCSLCTKTAQQLGEKPAQGLNSGILYLMIMPFAIVGFIGFRWWKNNKVVEEQEAGQ
jgi:hypothetical protein